jgi:hypothetical protein
MCGYQWDDERLSLALGDDSIFISPCKMRPQSFWWSTDWLVLVPSFRPLACTLGYAMHARAFLNLVRFGATLPVYFDRLRSCKFSMGASAAWQRASEGRADRQLRARKRRAGRVLKPKRPTEERCLVPCRVPTNPAPLLPCCAHHRRRLPDSPMTLGPVGDSITEPHAAPGLSLSPSLRAACVCSVCPPACVDLLRALDGAPTAHCPRQPSPPLRRMPDRPHTGAKRRAST